MFLRRRIAANWQNKIYAVILVAAARNFASTRNARNEGDITVVFPDISCG
jgi:hypothetical protein